VPFNPNPIEKRVDLLNHYIKIPGFVSILRMFSFDFSQGQNLKAAKQSCALLTKIRRLVLPPRLNEPIGVCC